MGSPLLVSCNSVCCLLNLVVLLVPDKHSEWQREQLRQSNLPHWVINLQAAGLWMSCSGDRALCRETYLFPCLHRCAPSCLPSGHPRRLLKGSWRNVAVGGWVSLWPICLLQVAALWIVLPGVLLLLFSTLWWRMAPGSSFPGWVLPSWKAVQELRSPHHPWGSAGSWWQEPWPSFTLVLPSLTTLTPHHDGTQVPLWKCFHPCLTEDLLSSWLSSPMVQTLGLAAPKLGQIHLREAIGEGAIPTRVAPPGFVGLLLLLAAATVLWAGGSAAPPAHGTHLRSCGSLAWGLQGSPAPCPEPSTLLPLLLAVAPDGMEEAVVQYPAFVCASACVPRPGRGQRSCCPSAPLRALGFGAEGLSPAMERCCYVAVCHTRLTEQGPPG